MNEFEKLCESLGIIKTIKRERYPREIRLSEEFLAALKKEFYHHKLEEDSTAPVRNYPEKFAKALRFEISHLNDRADIELQALRQKFEENNDQRVPEVKVAGKEKELPQNDAPKNTPPKEEKLCKGKRLVLKRNATSEIEEASKEADDYEYQPTHRDKSISSSMPRKSKHGTGVARWASHQEVKDKKLRSKWVNKRKTM